MKLYLGADHRGYHVKEQLKRSLQPTHEVVDLGAHELSGQDDFVDFAASVGKAVAQDPASRGILLCGSGVGMCIAANKVPGVRCAVGHSVDEVRAARHDDDVNVLSLAADFLTFEQILSIAEAFLKTDFAQEDRYVRRLAKIGELENHG